MCYYYVYRITCVHPQSKEKYYYGSRKSKLPIKKDNYWSSSKYVKNAIIKYGIEYFEKKILFVYDNRIDALKKEMYLHEKFDVGKNPIFFNRCKATIWGYNSTGDILSGTTYEEIHGKEKAEKLKKERSESMKRERIKTPLDGTRNPNYGNKWSEEQKIKFSEQRQNENHPCYGLIWINNGKISKKIKKEDSIPNGWHKGRITKDSYKKEYYKELFLESNMSRKDFAKHHGINYNTMKRYLKGIRINT